MTNPNYEIVEREGGFAWKLGDAFSETYPTRDAASAAAIEDSAKRQSGKARTNAQADGDARRWHDEMADNDTGHETDIINSSAHRY
ncbi:hypothetical protein [Oricola sp.]|uniref:hypothetical protein n=1 Tax=Oricola sp. TaxID=1979950 RepID=UPI000C8C6939|nr:hypothetical protein [Ahrensia sp.]